jgi:hypothetical protein
MSDGDGSDGNKAPTTRSHGLTDPTCRTQAGHASSGTPRHPAQILEEINNPSGQVWPQTPICGVAV